MRRRAHRQHPFGVVLIDLDRFKEIDDSLGHAAGDQLLCTLSGRLMAHVPGTDSIARLGGDEFVVLAARVTDEVEAKRLAERLQAVIALPIPLCGLQAHITASIGIALGPVPGATGAVLLQRADAAMYHIKNNRRSGSKVFSAEVQLPARERLETDDGLRNALSCGEFVLHYQPKLNVRSGRVEGADALAASGAGHGRAGGVHSVGGRDGFSSCSWENGPSAKHATRSGFGRTASWAAYAWR